MRSASSSPGLGKGPCQVDQGTGTLTYLSTLIPPFSSSGFSVPKIVAAGLSFRTQINIILYHSENNRHHNSHHKKVQGVNLPSEKLRYFADWETILWVQLTCSNTSLQNCTDCIELNNLFSSCNGFLIIVATVQISLFKTP